MKKQTLPNRNYYLLVISLMALLLSGCTNDQGINQIQLTDYPEHESEEATLYISKCSGCHAAPLPKIHTARQWPGVVQRMEMRMNNKAVKPPSSQETAVIIGYLQKHARK